MFARGVTHNTSYISVGIMLYYVIMNTVGFIYVNICNMNCSRESIQFSNHESKADFYKTVLASPFLFFLGNNIALRT